MIVGVIVSEPGGVVLLLASDGEGILDLYPLDEVVIDWRFDPRTGIWSDVTELELVDDIEAVARGDE